MGQFFTQHDKDKLTDFLVWVNDNVGGELLEADGPNSVDALVNRYVNERGDNLL